MQSDRLPSTRKAYSATKVRDIERRLSHSFKEHGRISCASASNYSSRSMRNFHELKNVKYSGTMDKFTIADSRKKLFLYATQVLGKLKKFGEKCYADSQYSFPSEVNEVDADAHNLKLIIRKVNYYYNLLKRLLEHRCILLLNEESLFCMKQIQTLAIDLKFLYTNEMLKLATMPVKTYNRFIDSSGISITILQELFTKVNYVCDLYLSLKNNYQKIISFFHVGFDMELYQRFINVNKFLNELFAEMFYWTHKILDVFILKLCLADTDSISPEFLHHVVEMYDSFNSLFINKKQIKYTCLGNVYNVFFNSYIQFDYEAVLLDFILQYLSHFEAKVASEKIIHFLSYECKNRIHSFFQEENSEKWKKDKEAPNSNTSDYYSASPTVIDTENITVTESSNFNNIYLSLIQRNQSLVLKYVYSITSLNMSVAIKTKENSSDSYGETTVGGNAWNLSKTGYGNKNYLYLEERYWMHFWQKVLKFSLKLILEVPCHQYGNAGAGVFLFWPHSYHYVFLNYLHSCVEITDISVAGLDVIKKMYHALHIQTICESWDKKMSSALSLIHDQPCMPIPVAPNRIRTRIGNILYSCLEALKVSKDHIILENLYLQMFCHYQITLDCIMFFYTVKARTSISFCDISSFLFLSRSDCVYICKLLEEKDYFNVFISCRHLRLFSSYKKENFIMKQIEILAGHVSEAPNVIYQTVSLSVKENLLLMLKKRFTKNVYYNNLNKRAISLNGILDSFTNTIGYIYDGIDVLYAITSAYAHETLHIMQLMQRNLSKKKVQVLKEIMLGFLKWINQQNIDSSELEKLNDMNCLKKLQCIIEIIESSFSKQPKYQRVSNKVSPLVSDKTIESCTLLTEEERIQWQLCFRHSLFLCL